MRLVPIAVLLPLLACGRTDPPVHAPPPPGPVSPNAMVPVPRGRPEPVADPTPTQQQLELLGLPLRMLVPTRDPLRGVMLDLPFDATEVACDAKKCLWTGATSQTRFTMDFKDIPVLNENSVRVAAGDLGDVREEPAGHWQVKQNCGHFWHFLPVRGRMVRLHCQIEGLSHTGRGSCTADEPRHSQMAKACESLRPIAP